MKFRSFNLNSLKKTFLILLITVFVSLSAQAKMYFVNGFIDMGPCTFAYNGWVETDGDGSYIHANINYSGPCGMGNVWYRVAAGGETGSNDPKDHDITQTVDGVEVDPIDLDLAYALFYDSQNHMVEQE